ncbi:transcription factor Opi1-domain-containing protein [Lentinula raphanica]|nr:transcription factor Opi1-domain-containing protein [Lentinula raphanica]
MRLAYVSWRISHGILPVIQSILLLFSLLFPSPMNVSDSQNSDSHSEQPPGTPHLAQSNTPSSSLASTSTLLEDQDEDVRIAVRALGDMRSGNIGGAARDSVPLSQSTSSKTVSSSSPVLSSPSTSSNNAQLEPDFVSRMTHIPLVNGALRMYEQGKASSRVVKYGAEIMENSVKTISRPVIDRLPTGQLDDFACRQLDRLDKYRWPSQDSQVAVESQRREEEERERMERMSRVQSQRRRDDYDSGSNTNEGTDEVGRWLGDMTSSNSLNNSRSSLSTSPRSPANSRDRDRYHDQSEMNPPSSSTAEAGPSDFRGSSSEYRSTSDDRWASRTHHTHRREREDLHGQRGVVQRSGLRNLLLEAGSFSVAWSEESLTKLRYVLQRLQDATNHIDQQILAIREFTEALQQHYLEGSPSTPTTNAQDPSDHVSSSTSFPSFPTGAAHSRSSSESQAISPAHRHKLDAIRRDVIKTVRNVVSVVSKYGGNAAIPEPARTTVKAYIMQLPKKVGEAMRLTQMGGLADVHHGHNGHNGHPGMALAGPSGDVSGRDAAASGRAGRLLTTTTARKAGRGDRGLGGSWSAAPSPMSSKTNSPTASPRSIPFRGLHPSASSVNGFNGEDDAIGTRTSGHQMSAGTAVMAAKRILTLATESLDMMRGVTGVVQDSLERADAWIERLRIHREDGPSNVQAAGSAGSSRPISPSTASEYEHERERGWMNLTLDPVMMQRGRDADSTPLSPLSIGTTNLERSRRSSVGSSTGFTYGDSLPSTPGLSGNPPAPYGANVSSYSRSYLDERPEVGLGIRRMNIRGEGEEEEVDIKKEEPEVKMEVDG